MGIGVHTHSGVLVLRLSGAASPAVVRGWLDELEDVPAYHQASEAIFDLRDVDLSALTQDQVRRAVLGLRGRQERGPARVAYVVAGELAFGVARMFSSLAEAQVQRGRAVFRTVDEAVGWLQQDPVD